MNDDYQFKNPQEIYDFFRETIFEFEFSCDGIIEFNTIVPIKLNNEYYDFKLLLFLNEEVFFKYSSFCGSNAWLKKFQIFEVYRISIDQNVESKLMFHDPFDESLKQNKK